VTNKKAQLGIIFLTVFIDLIGFGIVIPILPLYAQRFGANETVIGLLLGTYSLMQFLFSPVLGKISDRVGRRPVLLVSLVATAIGFGIMGFAQTLAWLFIGRIIPGISGGNISTAQAYIADITSPEERSRAMGMIGAAFGLGFTLGPAIGGLLSHYSIAAPFLFASGLALFNAVLAFIRLPESLPPEHRVTTEQRAPIGQVFKHGWHLPTLMASYFFSIAGFAIMTTIFALFTEVRFGYGPQKIGEVFAFIGFIGIVVQGGLLRQLLKRQSEKSLAVTGAILLVVGMALLPRVGGLASLLAVAALIGIGNSLTTPTLNGLASRSAERSWQGRVIGLMQSSGSLARCIGPFIAGEFLYMDVDKLGHPLSYYGRTPCWVASGILCISLVLTLQLPAKPITAAA
jgi:DHA1 family tetracycline resistance protein-like MFS transporter